MKLETEAGSTIHSPGPSDIEHALQALGEAGNTYAILGPDPLTYVQVAVHDEEWLLEYQSGQTDEHYQANSPVSRQQAIAMFQRYAAGDPHWGEQVEWHLYDMAAASNSGCRGTAASVLLVAFVLFCYLAVWA